MIYLSKAPTAAIETPVVGLNTKRWKAGLRVAEEKADIDLIL